ncbi:MAG: HNH endonuclease signature motif containing protein [Nanoarchaeota archaeon]
MKQLFLSFAPPKKWRDKNSRSIHSEEWQNIRKKILNRDNYICVYCGYKSEKYPIIDHIDGDPENDEDKNLQVVCQMCNMVKHAGQGCVIRKVVGLYKKSKYPQNEIIKIIREMRDKEKSDKEIIEFLELKEKIDFKMNRDYLKRLFGFVISNRALLQKDEEKCMYNSWLDYHKEKIKNEQQTL